MKPTKNFHDCKVDVSMTLRDAMSAIDRAALGIALVVDGAEHLCGTVTDGDVRRALLNGAGIEAPLAQHMQRQFSFVGPEVGRVEVLDLMQARLLDQIPILDREGRLLGLHLIHEMIGAINRPNWAVIMAGGKGTRLRPLTENLPKPMIRVAGRPILERLVLHLVGFGIRKVFLAINYLGDIIQSHFGDGERFGCEVQYLRETEPMGTGGALSLLPAFPEKPLLVLNGDLVTQADLGGMLDFHRQGGQVATVGVRRYFHQVPYGCIETEGTRILSMEEKPVLTRLANAGMYVLDPTVLKRVPRERYDMPSLVEECLRRNEPVRVFEILDEWVDVGQGDQLRNAREGQ